MKRNINCLIEVEHSCDSKKTEYTNNSAREEVSNRDAKHVRLTSRRACSGGVNEAKQSCPMGTGLIFMQLFPFLRKLRWPQITGPKGLAGFNLIKDLQV